MDFVIAHKMHIVLLFTYKKNTEGDIQSGIIASKTKVAPVKRLSIPRLEIISMLDVKKFDA